MKRKKKKEKRKKKKVKKQALRPLTLGEAAIPLRLWAHLLRTTLFQPVIHIFHFTDMTEFFLISGDLFHLWFFWQCLVRHAAKPHFIVLRF